MGREKATASLGKSRGGKCGEGEESRGKAKSECKIFMTPSGCFDTFL